MVTNKNLKGLERQGYQNDFKKRTAIFARLEYCSTSELPSAILLYVPRGYFNSQKVLLRRDVEPRMKDTAITPVALLKPNENHFCGMIDKFIHGNEMLSFPRNLGLAPKLKTGYQFGIKTKLRGFPNHFYHRFKRCKHFQKG